MRYHKCVTSSLPPGVNHNDNNDDIEEIRPPPPPMGMDKTKPRAREKGKVTSSNLSVRTERSARSKKIMAQMTQLNLTLEKHITETVGLTKYLLLLQDVSQFDPEDQEATKMVKASIREKYNLKNN
ncbi:unnamed protein product [Lactuca saligna]|uniref:No apical meristem-associated C-terminal domain-containing protein n=1 Tax=Lactuca saligna TaxID=75948 RepID=A0AA36EJ10_LACSI|nr:unnamed protein product [Lactuca saligna]